MHPKFRGDPVAGFAPRGSRKSHLVEPVSHLDKLAVTVVLVVVVARTLPTHSLRTASSTQTNILHDWNVVTGSLFSQVWGTLRNASLREIRYTHPHTHSLSLSHSLSVCLSVCLSLFCMSALCDDTQDRSAWRTLCHEAVTQFEDSRVDALEHKRAVRKGVQPRSNLSTWPCDSCSHVCSSRIGLHAHQQTHRWQAIRRFRRRSPFRSVCSKLSPLIYSLFGWQQCVATMHWGLYFPKQLGSGVMQQILKCNQVFGNATLMLRSSNVILQTLLCIKQSSVNSLTSLYNIRLNVLCDAIKQSIWQYNVRNAVDTGRLVLL